MAPNVKSEPTYSLLESTALLEPPENRLSAYIKSVFTAAVPARYALKQTLFSCAVNQITFADPTDTMLHSN